MAKRATIVVCYNNRDKFREFEQELSRQSEQMELAAIDNTSNRYSSCASAYNSVLAGIRTEYVIFSHQDIRFSDCDSIRQFLDDCEKTERYDIVGVAGRKRGFRHSLGNLCYSDGVRATGIQITSLKECDTVDECFFGGRTECFQKYPFSETLCNGWHLYAVERCCAALARKSKVYVSPSSLVHLSSGRTDHKYNVLLYKICLHYRHDLDFIATTCESSSTKPLKRECALIYREMHVLKRNFLEQMKEKR